MKYILKRLIVSQRGTDEVSTFCLPISVSRSNSPKLENDQQPPSPLSSIETPYYDSPQLLEESADPNANGEGFRRSLSRRFSRRIRRSWGSRRNSIGTIASTDEEPNWEEWNSEASTKVRRVSRQRDWSGELGEDDIWGFRINRIDEGSRTSLADDLSSRGH
jgi:hypothetical protein